MPLQLASNLRRLEEIEDHEELNQLWQGHGYRDYLPAERLALEHDGPLPPPEVSEEPGTGTEETWQRGDTTPARGKQTRRTPDEGRRDPQGRRVANLWEDERTRRREKMNSRQEKNRSRG